MEINKKTPMQLKMVDHFMFAILSKLKQTLKKNQLYREKKKKNCMHNIFAECFGPKLFRTEYFFGRKLYVPEFDFAMETACIRETKSQTSHFSSKFPPHSCISHK